MVITHQESGDNNEIKNENVVVFINNKTPLLNTIIYDPALLIDHNIYVQRALPQPRNNYTFNRNIIVQPTDYVTSTVLAFWEHRLNILLNVCKKIQVHLIPIFFDL
jgi:hypothetical protein